MFNSQEKIYWDCMIKIFWQRVCWHLCPVFTHFAISCFSTFFIWCKCVWIFRKVDWPLFRCFQLHHTNSSHFLEISVANGNLIHCKVMSVSKNCDNIDIAPWSTKKKWIVPGSKVFLEAKCFREQSIPGSKLCWGLRSKVCWGVLSVLRSKVG